MLLALPSLSGCVLTGGPVADPQGRKSARVMLPTEVSATANPEAAPAKSEPATRTTRQPVKAAVAKPKPAKPA